MPTHSRTFRIFVSSTFADMKAERNALQEHVFPNLQKLCEEHGCRFQAVDLRWGVSEEAALDQQTMNICLTELKRCQEVSPRPNFMILLGDRYGWMPLPPQIEQNEFEQLGSLLSKTERAEIEEWYKLDTNAIPAEYYLRARDEKISSELDYDSWNSTEAKLRAILLQGLVAAAWPADDMRRIKYECSATHQEIINGALKSSVASDDHVLAFLRTIANVEDLPANSEYVDDGIDAARALKETVKETKGVTSFTYDAEWTRVDLKTDLDRFIKDALESLTKVITEELKDLETIDELTREDDAHKSFGSDRCRHFIGRQQILQDIAAYTANEQLSPLVVFGPSGSGKSALMAKAVATALEDRKDANVIQRYVGATPASTDIRTLLLNLCQELTRLYGGDPATIPAEYKDLVEELPKRMALATKQKPLLLFLDALDQLSPTDNSHSLNWLPQNLPENVNLVVSVLERDGEAGESLRSAQSKLPAGALLHLENMAVAEGAEALQSWLKDANRDLTGPQREGVLTAFEKCPYPLYLKLAFEEARRWKSYPGSLVAESLAADIPGVVRNMLARLQDKRNHGVVLVSTFLGLLSASRHGLAETEVLELLSEDQTVMADLKARSARSPEASGIPAVVWLRLYHDLEPYLMERSADGTVLFNFYHRQVDETVRNAYPISAYHNQLAAYFSDDEHRPLWQGDGKSRKPNIRRCSELPFQQTKAELWDLLVATLTDLDFIEAKSKAGQVYDLVADFNRAERELPEGQEEQSKEEARQARIAKYVAELIAHSSDPDHVLLPTPPETVPYQPPDQEEGKVDWTQLERIKAWGHFVTNHIQPLAAGEEPVFEMAWNSTDGGPVAERLAELQSAGHGPTSEWLRLRNRPAFSVAPACLKAMEGHTDIVNAVCITPDGRRAVSGSSDSTLRVWDLETGVSSVLEGHTGLVDAVCISADGRRAVSGSHDKTLRAWDLETGNCVLVCGMSGSIACATVSGLTVAAGGDSGRVDVLTLENISFGPAILTPAKLWLHDKRAWDGNLTAQCPLCGARFVVRAEWIGQEVACPNAACGNPMKFNSFVCDNRDLVHQLNLAAWDDRPWYRKLIVPKPKPDKLV